MKTALASMLLAASLARGATLPWHAHAQERDRPGTVRGVVRLAGTDEVAPTRVVNTTDPGECGGEHSLEDLVVATDGRGIRYVVVSVVGTPSISAPAAVPSTIEIDNVGCRFVPHVAVAQVGDTILAVNSDPVLHTTHYYGPLRSNVALPRVGMRVPRVVRAPGTITVLCDVHGWMKAFIQVDTHGLHAVTDETGAFVIADVPPGRHTVRLWHERLGRRDVVVDVEAGGVTEVDIRYDPLDLHRQDGGM